MAPKKNGSQSRGGNGAVAKRISASTAMKKSSSASAPASSLLAMKKATAVSSTGKASANKKNAAAGPVAAVKVAMKKLVVVGSKVLMKAIGVSGSAKSKGKKVVAMSMKAMKYKMHHAAGNDNLQLNGDADEFDIVEEDDNAEEEEGDEDDNASDDEEEDEEDEDVDEIDNDEEANHEQQNEAENQVEDDEEGKHLVGYAHYLHVFAKEFGWFCCYLDEPFRFSEKKAVPGAVNKSNEAVDDPEPPNPPKFFPNGRKNPQWKRGKDKWKKWYERERKRKEKLEQQANEEELQSTNLFFRIPKLLYKKSCGVKCKDPKPKWNSLTWSALFVITVGLYLGVSLGIVYRWVFSAGNGSLALFAGVDEESGCTAPITGGGECSEGVATSGQTGGTISAAADAATTPTEKEVVFASEKLPQLPWAKKKPQLPEEEAAAAVAEKVRTSTSRKGANTKGEEAVDRTEDARKILRNKNTSSLTTGKTEEPQGATGSRFAADRQKTTHTSTDAEQSSSRSPVVEEHNEAAKVKGKEKKRVYKIRPGRDYTDRSVPRRAVTDALRAFVDQGGVESVRRLHQAKILREKNDDTSAPGPRLDPASPPSEAPSPTAGAVFSPAPTSIAEGDPASSDSGIPLTTSRGRVGDNDSRPRKFESAPTAQPLEHDNEHHARFGTDGRAKKFRSSKSPDEHGSRSSNANAPHVQHDHSDGLATGPSTSRTSAEEDD